MSARTACVILGILAATGIGGAQQGAGQGEWTRYGGDPGSTKYAPLDQIDRSNISRLRIAWQRPAVDPSISSRVPDFSYSNNFRATPLMIDGVLYGPNGIGLVEAFHPATGKTIWVQQPFPDEPAQGLRGDSTRGVTYWSDGTERRLYVIRGEYLIALDLRSGQPIASFGEKGRVALRPGLGPLATNVFVDRRRAGLPRRGHRRRRARRDDRTGPRTRSRRPATSRRSTCAPESRGGRSKSFPNLAKLAATPGRGTPGRIAARRTCGR